MSGGKQKLFGFEIKGKKPSDNLLSPVEIHDEYGMPFGGAYTTGHLVDYRFRSESELISYYREMALHSEIEYAIDEILNECFIYTGYSDPVSIVLKDAGLDKEIEKKIRDEFHNILRLLSFKNNAYEIFRRWYIDGRLYFQLILSEKNTKDGIQEIRYIDPLQIKNVREPLLKMDDKGNMVYAENSINEYYEYYPLGIGSAGSRNKVLIAKDGIVYVPSGLYDRSRGIVISHLDKSIKPLNNLRHLEDSSVIYTLARAPMRRAFYVDVDGMPAAKQEQYMRETMARHRNKVDYDPKTGIILDNRKYQAMLEDYWFPRKGSKNTEVENIDGSGSLMDMENVRYFKRNLYQSLNVPFSRLEPDAQMSWGKDAEISREEIKFSKFVNRLRHTFSSLFDKILRVQLSAKGIISVDDWDSLSQDISYQFEQEMHYHEMQKLEIISKRLDVLDAISGHVGQYYSEEFVKKDILGQNEQFIKDQQKQIKKEQKVDQDEIDSMDEFDNDSNINTQGNDDPQDQELTKSAEEPVNTQSKEYGDDEEQYGEDILAEELLKSEFLDELDGLINT